MRKALALLVGALALVTAGVVVASPQFAATFEMAHSPSTAGSSAGIETLMGRVLALPPSLALLELHAKIKPYSRRHGRKRRVYFRNPPICPPSGEWTTTVTWTYADGSTQQLTDGTPCRSR